jgi:MFS family permease
MQITSADRRAWLTLAILCGINFMNFYDRQILPVVQDDVAKEWNLSDGDLGNLGTAFILLYAVVGVPLGRLADVWKRTTVLALGAAVWSVLTAASGFAWSFWTLFACRLGVGVGEASCAPTASSMIGDLFPPERRSRALAVFMIGLPLGLGVSSVLSGVIARSFGWQAAFYIPAVPGLILAVAVLFVGETSRGQADRLSTTRETRSFLETCRVVLALPTMWWIIISGAVHNFNTYALGTFLTSAIRRYHKLDPAQAGLASGLVWGIGALGMFLAGWLGDAVYRRRVGGRLEVGCGAIALAVPFILFGLAVPPGNPWQFAFWLVLTYAMMSAYYGTVYAAIQDIVEPSLRGTAMAVYFFAMYLLGAVHGPRATGWISDTLALRAARLAGVEPTVSEAGRLVIADEFRAAGLHQALYVVPVLCVGLVVILFAASRTVARDRERLLARAGASYTSRS